MSSSVLENNRIVSIKENAFNNCLSFVDVVLPDNVTSVANNAFKGCANINKFTIGNGVKTFDSENFSGWNNLEELVIKDSETDLDMGENVVGELLYQIIKEDSYYYYDRYSAGSLSKMPIKKMYLGRSIKKSEYYKLHTYIINHCARMTSLVDLTIGPEVSRININDFYGCDSLLKITFADGDKELMIEKDAFKNTTLPHVYIGRSIKGIDTKMCLGEGVKDVVIGHNLSSIGDIELGNALENLVIGQNVTELYFKTYDNLKSIKSYAANPPSTYNFKDNVYINCTLTVPSNAVSNYEKSSPWNKFWNIEGAEELVSFFVDSDLTFLIHDDSITCTLIKADKHSVEVPVKAKYKDKEFLVTKIDEKAFENVVYYVTLNSDFEYIPKLTANWLKTLTINGNVGYLGGYTGNPGYPQGHLSKVIVNGNVETIGVKAFSGCEGLTTFEVNGKIKSIGKEAFYYCSELTDILINGDSASIDTYAFRGCTKLEEVKFVNTFKNIGNKAFYNCPKLQELHIPASVETIGSFDGCKGLRRLYIEDGDKPLYVDIEGTRNSYNSVNKYVNGKQYYFYYCHGAFYGTSLDSVYIGRSINYKMHTVSKNTTTVSYCLYAAPFVDVDSLKKVTIGPLVKDLGSQSDTIDTEFSYKVEIYDSHVLGMQDTIAVLNPIPPSGASFTDNAYKNSVVIVPKGSISNYKEAFGWKKFVNIKEKLKKYTVTYVVNDEIYTKEEVTEGDTLILPNGPVKEGYTLVWDHASEVMPECDITISGTYSINTYLVTFKIDGEVIASDSLEYGSTIIVPEVPERKGHTFNGWGEVADSVPAYDLTYEGSYSVNSYLLTYTVDDEIVQSDSVVYGTAITLLEEPTKEGHTFSGWSEAPDTMPANDVTVNGTFTVNKYLVTFKIEDEIIVADSLEYGSAIITPEAPKREGHTFNGWGEVADSVPAYDLTYEGSYSVNSYLLTYTVDGETVQSDSIAYSAAITLIEEPTKEGYTFSGWSEAPETMPANDITVSGAFTINKYLVTFKIGDEVIAADSLEYGAMIVTPEAPEREGYTFDGWGDVVETVPANDVTIEGSYTANIYKVYYYVGEELVHTAEVTYGEAIPEYIYEPTEEGYTFLGWLGELYETMPAHDVTYTANIESGINQLLLDNGQLIIYDLMGRKVLNMENLKGGIYIVNGKKVVVK